MLYARLAAAGTTVVQKQPNQITKLKHMVMTANATGTLTFTDGTNTFVIDVPVGVWKFKRELAFAPDSDVTITCAGATISIFADIIYG